MPGYGYNWNFDPWGWVIYRTTYTPESDILWPQFLNLVTKALSAGVRRNLKQNEDARDHDSEMKCLENIFMDDIKFDGATHNDLRAHFTKWLQTQVTEIYEDEEGEEVTPPHPRHNNLLVVDEAVLQNMKTAPSLDDYYSKPLKKSPYLKAVKASHNDANRDRLAPRYSGRNNALEGLLFPGFMRIPLVFLRDFWEVTSEYVDIVEVCPVVFTEEPCWDPEQDSLNEY